MSEIIRSTGQNLWLWRAIFFNAINGYFIAVGGAVIAAHLLNPHQESWLGCFIVGAKFLEGFMNQGVSQLKSQIQNAFQTSFIPRPADSTQKPNP